MNDKLTDWFPADVKPERVGVYMTQMKFLFMPGGQVGFSYWDGKRWGYQWAVPASAIPARRGEAPTQDKAWCGRRRWVLAAHGIEYVSNGFRPKDWYLVDARPKSNEFDARLVKARPFPSERAAKRFAARYKLLGLTAVLP